MLSILLVEDDPLLGQGLQIGLEQRDHRVRWVRHAADARSAFAAGGFDCVVLDLQLGDADGLNLLRQWRDSGSEVPVVIVSARDGVADRISGLDLGADDYLVKPMSVDELAARIRAVYRRRGGAAVSQLAHGAIRLDPHARQVTREGDAIALSDTEFRLLQTLMEHGERVATKSFLEQHLRRDGVDSNAVEVHIHKLRKKLGKDTIRTVRGVGYVLEPAGAA